MAAPRSLTAAQARRMRIAAQEVRGSQRAPADAVRRMVAMQGQDLPQVLRAIAIRSAPGTGLAEVRAAFDAGELVRSWAMRGTLFVATPDDLAVLHAATVDRLRPQEWRMCAARGIDAPTADAAAAVLREMLAPGPVARRALLAEWEAAGIATGGGRGYHLLALLAYDGLVRFGPFEDAEQLLVGGPPPAVPEPAAALDEALARWAAARGPARADDAAWWTGLPKRPVRAALERASDPDRGVLERVLVDGVEMLVAAGAAEARRSGAVLVPGFDEWLLGYGDRSLAVSAAAMQAIVPGGNGVFRPVVLVDGVAVGTWRLPAGGRGEPVLELVAPVPPRTLAAIEAALRRWPHR
ncbi:winged helix DNA-binding domain-containing protein [Agrococcus sediminis]|uniref:winged helix DNA-binding domain-containing protein n=1 Tax=Agrococcus sediminis TaxID=2599924 RepID=UPI00344A24C4